MKNLACWFEEVNQKGKNMLRQDPFSGIYYYANRIKSEIKLIRYLCIN